MVYPRLTYFDFEGRGEPIRLAFAIGNVPFEDHRIAFADWKEAKASKTPSQFTFGQLPSLEVQEGVHVSQSMGLSKYAGTLSGIYPRDDVIKALRVDEVMEAFSDLCAHIAATLSMGADQMKEARQKLVSGIIPTTLKGVEELIVRNGDTGFSVGSELTMADLWLDQIAGWIASGTLEYIPAETVNAYPKIKGVMESVAKDPRVQAYRLNKAL